jgi:tetratricopeptide (TPR) repeat protein
MLLLDYLVSIGMQYNDDPMELYLRLRHPGSVHDKDLPEFIGTLGMRVFWSISESKGVSDKMRKKYAERIKYAGKLHYAHGDAKAVIAHAEEELKYRQQNYDRAVEHYNFAKENGWDADALKDAQEAVDEAMKNVAEAKDLLEAAQWNGPYPMVDLRAPIAPNQNVNDLVRDEASKVHDAVNEERSVEASKHIHDKVKSS